MKLAIRLIANIIAAIIGLLAPSFIGGAYYGFCGDHVYEQQHLDRYISYLQSLRTNDPELRRILDYTIRRYSKVGAWDVAFMPLSTPLTGSKAIGCNCPWCPGLTLDTEVLGYSPRDGALLLVHEALHDYRPYFGHSYVDSVMKRIEAL